LLNDISLKYTQKELVELGLSVAKGERVFDDILFLIKDHKV